MSSGLQMCGAWAAAATHLPADMTSPAAQASRVCSAPSLPDAISILSVNGESVTRRSAPHLSGAFFDVGDEPAHALRSPSLFASSREIFPRADAEAPNTLAVVPASAREPCEIANAPRTARRTKCVAPLHDPW